MLSSVQIQEIRNDVMISRRKRGLKPEALAGKVGVGARFIRNLEQEKSIRWEMRHLVRLLRVLMYLKLEQQIITVQAVMQSVSVIKKMRRLKFDRRQGGRVYTRR